MYLYDYLSADPEPAPPAQQNHNGTTASRLSVIEVTSIASVVISASILIFHVWKATHDEQQRQSLSLARRTQRP